MTPLATYFRDGMLAMGSVAFQCLQQGVDRQLALQHAARLAFEVHGQESPISIFGPSLAAAWAECGFPTLEPSHKLAASLMATTMPAELVTEAVRMPWRCFAFVVPAGVIGAAQEFAVVIKAKTGLVNMLSTHPVLDGGDSAIHYGTEPSLADWNLKILRSSIGGDEIDPSHPKYTSFETSNRFTELLGRLFVGLCAELNGHPLGLPVRHDGKGTKRRRHPFPRTHVFKLTRDVKLDVRAAVLAYARGERSQAPSVQVLVRGHWKRQPHGTGGTLRRLIHVEPYWRGPEDAPIGVRSHQMGET